MSQVLLQEAIAIGQQLSVTEKLQLLESVTVQLRQALDVTQQPSDLDAPNGTDDPINGHNHAVNGYSEKSVDEIPPTWTDEEIRALMRPDPKTGAEIAAMIESGEIDTSIGAEMEIDDVVTCLEDLRRQERIERGLEA